jgi:hypothetical protein
VDVARSPCARATEGWRKGTIANGRIASQLRIRPKYEGTRDTGVKNGILKGRQGKNEEAARRKLLACAGRLK